MSRVLQTIALLVVSNAFMTVAWYGHLRTLAHRPWLLVALLAWGIALVEYLFQVPANRIGYTVMTLPQLKILQESISLLVFIPFSIFVMRTPLGIDYLYASLCILGAVFFIFRSSWVGG